MIDYEALTSEISKILQQYIKDNGEVSSAIMDVVRKSMEFAVEKQFEYIRDTQSSVAETVTKSIQDGWKAATDMNEAILDMSSGKHQFDSFLRVVRKDNEKDKK